MDESRSTRLRLGLLGVVALSLFAALFARLWYLQVLESEPLVQEAVATQTREIMLPASRGRLIDVNGRVLVDNRPSLVLTIDKREMLDALETPAERQAMYLRLATELSARGRLTKVSEISAEVESERFGPFDEVQVVRDVREDFAVFLAERSFDFPGVSTEVVEVRRYPYGDLAAHVLGYVGAINETELENRTDSVKRYGPNDEIGKTGLEAFFEDFLRGTPGLLTVEVSRTNQVLQVVSRVDPVPGNDIQLTIDIDLQALAESELARGLVAARGQEPETRLEGLAFHEAPAGALVILDPRDGSVRAMASNPTYEPSQFVNGIPQVVFDELNSADADNPLLNRAIQGQYPPGSTFKVFTTYGAFASGLYGSSDLPSPIWGFEDKGTYRVLACQAEEGSDQEAEQCTYQNPGKEPMGTVGLVKALARSSDNYWYYIADLLDTRAGYDKRAPQQAATLFGLGQTTGISLAEERGGRMPTPEQRQALFEECGQACVFDDIWRTGDTLNVAIGQGGVLATPLQMANAYAAIANGGRVYVPNLASAVLDPVDGSAVLTYEPRVKSDVEFPDEWRDPIMDGLAGVTTFRVEGLNAVGGIDQGTGYNAFEAVGFPHDRWPVSGKTGTSERQPARNPDGSIKKLYADTAWFIGFGPNPDPEYVGAVVMEEAGFGGRVAAPVLARIFAAIADNSVPPAPLVPDPDDPTERPAPDVLDGDEAGDQPLIVSDGGR